MPGTVTLRRIADQVIVELFRATQPPTLAGAPPANAATILRAMLFQVLHSIPNERALRDRLHRDPIARRFVGPGQSGLDRSDDTYSHSRAQLLATGIATGFFQLLLKHPNVAPLLLDGRFTPDANLLDAWAGDLDAQSHRSATAWQAMLVLPEIPDALRYVPYLEQGIKGINGVNGCAPLETVLRRFADELHGSLTVACCSEALGNRLTPCVRRLGVRTLVLRTGSRLRQLVDAIFELRAANLALFSPGAALLPIGLSRRLCDHHLASLNDVTRVDALPDGARVEIYSRTCLRRLRSEVPRNVDFTPGAFLDWAGEVDRLRARFEDLRRVPYGGSIPADLPRRIAVDSVEDWRRLADAAQRLEPAAPASDPWHEVRAWRNAECQRPVVRRRSPATARARGPRVLYTTPSTGFTGPERMYASLMGGLLERGWDLWGLVVRPGMIANLLAPACRDRLIGDGIEFGRPTLSSFDYCLRTLRRVRPDVVHCNGISSWPMLAAAEVCRIPVVQHVRIADLVGLEDSLRSASRLIAVSRYVAGELARVGADPTRIRVCYDGVDVGYLRPSLRTRRAARTRLDIAATTFVVLCVARCERRKRLEVVLRAFADARRVRADARLLIVGQIDDVPYYESLEELIASYGIGTSVQFLRGVEDIRAVHAAADALMLASIRESLGMALLEAMAMQVPVIASASGGIPEMLDDSCGTLVPPDSVAAFGQALWRVAAGEDDLQRKARKARTVIERRFSLERHVDEVQALYREVTG